MYNKVFLLFLINNDIIFQPANVDKTNVANSSPVKVQNTFVVNLWVNSVKPSDAYMRR